MQNGSEAGASPAVPHDAADGEQRLRDLRTLRELLVGPEQSAISRIEERLAQLELTPEEVADLLPQAIALRAARDEQLARALGPTLERAFSESVQRNPQQLADAIYPTLGPAIRKAIAEAISAMVASINRAMQLGLSPQGLRWRFEAWRKGVPFGQLVLQRTLVYRVEQAYLIHSETGLLLTHVAAPDLAAPDADVISGMLTAIRDFVGDSFESRAAGGLRAFTVGDVTMLVEPGPRAMLAVTVRGEHPPSLVTRLQTTLELIHLRFARELAAFTGDNAPFEAARPLLGECLETVLDERGRGRTGAVPRIAWGIAAAVLLVLTVLHFREERAWRRARTAVAAEPGWVTLHASRFLRSWRFDGLRDPAARTPAEVLAAAGFDTTRVHSTWRSFRSADPDVLLTRAREVLSPPPTISMDVVGGALVLAGTAPTTWLENLRDVTLPGTPSIIMDAVTFRLPAPHDTIATTIGRTRILFVVGSAELSAEAQRQLTALADAWATARSAAGDRWAVRLTATGRTDTTGSAEMNRRLSDDRARAVAQHLALRGVDPAVVVPVGIGTSAPLEAPDLQERARINRSVSFSLSLVPRAGILSRR